MRPVPSSIAAVMATTRGSRSISLAERLGEEVGVAPSPDAFFTGLPVATSKKESPWPRVALSDSAGW